METDDPTITKRDIRRVVRRLDALRHKVERLDLIMMLKDPGSSIAADAYDGLRKQVLASANERMSHLNQLVQFDVALQTGATSADLARLVDEWLSQAGVVKIEDVGRPDADDLFEVMGDAHGSLEARRPAYVDAQTGRVVRLGRAERVGGTALVDAVGGAEAACAPAAAPVGAAAQRDVLAPSGASASVTFDESRSEA